MTKYNTGNPVGSADPRDLHDNATVADRLVNGDADFYPDRLGVNRRSWASVQGEAEAFFESSGYEFAGDYAAGIELTRYSQVVRDASGEFWRVSGSTTLPYTTTGAGLPEGGAFVAVGDAVLRQELAGDPATGQGAALVGGATIYVGSVAELEALDKSSVPDGQLYVVDTIRFRWLAGELVNLDGFLTPESMGGTPGGVVTDQVNEIIDRGVPVYLKGRKTYLYDGTGKQLPAGVTFMGGGTLKGEVQDAFLFTGGSLNLSRVTFEDFGRLFEVPGGATPASVEDISDYRTKYKNVYMGLSFGDGAEFKNFESYGVKARVFSRLYSLLAASYETVDCRNGDFDAEPGWGPETVVDQSQWAGRYIDQRYVLWVGDAASPAVGNVQIHNNKARNIVNEDGRADGFLAQRCHTFEASGNRLSNIMTNQTLYNSQGYLTYSDASGSALYSGAAEMVNITGNTCINAGTASIATTSAAVDVSVINNKVKSTVSPGWVDMGVYMRSDAIKVSNNKISGCMRPIRYINPENTTFRESTISDNQVRSATGGAAIMVELSRRLVSVAGNRIDATTNSHPQANTENLCGVYVSGIGASGSSNFVHDNIIGRLINDQAGTPNTAGVILHNAGADVMTNHSIKGNRTYANPCIGFSGSRQSGHDVDGNEITNGSGSPIAIFTNERVLLRLGYNKNFAKLISAEQTLSDTTTTGPVSIPGLETVRLSEEFLRLIYLKDTLAVALAWFTDFTSDGAFTVNLDAPSDNVVFRVEADLVGRAVEFNSV